MRPLGAENLRSMLSAIAASAAMLWGINASAVEHAVVPEFVDVPHFTSAGAAGVKALDANAQLAPCNPVTEYVTGNTVALDLHLKRVVTTINNPSDLKYPSDDLELRTYNGCLSAPQIDAKPGISLQIALHNDLSTDDRRRTRGTACLQVTSLRGLPLLNSKLHHHTRNRSRTSRSRPVPSSS